MFRGISTYKIRISANDRFSQSSGDKFNAKRHVTAGILRQMQNGLNTFSIAQSKSKLNTHRIEISIDVNKLQTN